MRALPVVVVAVLLAGCGLQPEAEPRALPPRTAPEAGPTATAPVLPGARPTTLYLVRDAMLAPVVRRASSGSSPVGALTLLLRGPTPGEGDQGLSSALAPDAVLLDEVQVEPGGLAVVPLRTLPAEGLVRSDEVLAYAQVVATLTALPGVRSVSFLRDGEPLAVPRADGLVATAPLTRRDYADLL